MPFREDVLAVCVNTSKVASQIIKSRLASYTDLDSVLGLEDALNILEVYQVSEHNKQVIEHYGRENN